MTASMNYGILPKHLGLYTDHYELTMAQGYFLNRKHELFANFDYFFRRNPFGGGYVVFSGLNTLLECLTRFSYSQEDLDYLEAQGFDKRFLGYLKNFQFSGSVFAPEEGELVFPNEPVVRVEGSLLEGQLIETIVLNMLNFESLIATKAARLRQIAGPDKTVIDFGLRRAQGLAGIQASKASVAGGCDSTSNVFAAKAFGIPSMGTMSHSWVQSYDDELTAFRHFAKVFPDQCVLLVDTYDTLGSGVPHAILVAMEMERRGDKLKGIRLDSGNPEYLSKAARKMLNDHGLSYVKIVVSNQLDEFLIRQLLRNAAPIDAFGVGTKLVTGSSDAALDGVYKLTEIDNKPILKISESTTKTIIPGIKDAHRFYDEDGQMICDGLLESNRPIPSFLIHPFTNEKMDLNFAKKRKLNRLVMKKGTIRNSPKTPQEIAKSLQKKLKQLPARYKQLETTEDYFVGISPQLFEVRNDLIKRYWQNGNRNSFHEKTEARLVK